MGVRRVGEEGSERERNLENWLRGEGKRKEIPYIGKLCLGLE
jgi:hypothetical protein